MRAADVGEIPVGDILEAARDTRRLVILDVRHVDDFREAIGYHTDHVRACVFLAEEIDFNIGSWIVAGDGAARVFDGVDVRAGWNEALIVQLHDLIGKTFVYENVPGRDAGGNQVFSNGSDYFGRRTDARSARAVELDSYDIAGVEEAAPGIAFGFRAGQHPHSARHHLANGGDVDV